LPCGIGIFGDHRQLPSAILIRSRMLTVVFAIPFSITHFPGTASIFGTNFGTRLWQAGNLAGISSLGRFGSATGNRSCDPLNFANKTGTFLTLLLVELTAFRKSPIFYPSVFAQKLVKFKFVFSIFLGQIGTKNRVRYLSATYAFTLDHSPTFVTRTLPSGCPRTETLSHRAAAYKPERNRLRLRSSVPIPRTSKC